MFYTYYEQYGNKIFLRYKKDGTNQTVSKVVDFYEPALYVGGDGDYQDIYGNKLKQVKFNDINAAKEYIDEYKDIDNLNLCGNSDFANQFIIDICDGQMPKYDASAIDIGAADIEVDAPEFPDPMDAKWPVTATTVYSSIENKFYSFYMPSDKNFVWDRSKSPDEIKDLDVELQIFHDEKSLMEAVFNHFRHKGYDVITGWHSEGFDVPYIINRGVYLFGEKYVEKALSPFNRIRESSIKNEFQQKQTTFKIYGLPHLDYMQLYKKLNPKNLESFKLDYVAHVELGKNKISYEEADSLHDLYKLDPQKYLDYNIQDVNLIKELDEKLGLFDLVYAMSYYCLSNFDKTLGKVKIWEHLVAKFLYNKGTVPPVRNPNKETSDFDGAFVKEPIPGLYKWVVSYDLNSLYPHCEMQWNIGQDTFVDREVVKTLAYNLDDDEINTFLEKKFDKECEKKVDHWVAQDIDPLMLKICKQLNLTVSPNFQFYRLDKMSFFSEIKRELYTERKSFKKQMLQSESEKVNADKKDKKAIESAIAKFDNMQMGLKLLLNGGYGALGNVNFLYYKVENAEAITSAGQTINKWTAYAIEDYLKNQIFQSNEHVYLAGDTDSAYFSLDQFVRTLKTDDIQEKVNLTDQFSKEIIEPFIDKRCEELREYMNCYEQKMVWEREVIAESAIWRAKKNYVMHVWDSEGVRYNEPKLKITGLEAKKTIVPEWAREALKEAYKIALGGTQKDMQKFIAKMKKDFKDFDTNEISLPSGVNNIEKWVDDKKMYKKGTPQQVKAALTHNMMLDKLNIKNIPPIVSGDKIRIVALKKPNPTFESVIGFDTYMPAEFDLDKYIDRKEILYKSFLKPINSILDVIGWSEKEKISLF